jgi:hypothetical protein
VLPLLRDDGTALYGSWKVCAYTPRPVCSVGWRARCQRPQQATARFSGHEVCSASSLPSTDAVVSSATILFDLHGGGCACQSVLKTWPARLEPRALSAKPEGRRNPST